ncbi:methyl-accepting chemotaxis protein [uncultured Aquitalea sp.]|uniref:methyl-accepting chemotaxis protein n=1 Tax=uncultured Aquitalea sp. TaxID=540272 RepID=UPI0025DD3FBA|nr:methyl-accepting chemotaxis protein [uncultured Aquitalea sp.]
MSFSKTKSLSLAQKLSVLISIALLTVLGLAGFLVSNWLSTRMEQHAVENMSRINRQVIDMVDAYASRLEREAADSTSLMLSSLPGNWHVAAGAAPVLMAGDTALNGNEATVDRFSQATHGAATFFVRDGDRFVRIASSLKKEDGSRAVGTSLDSSHPAYALLKQGQEYTGPARLFGRDYMTHYRPLKDAAGQVVGAAFTGVDYTEGLQALKSKVMSIRIGDTGYVFVMDARGHPGDMLIHPAKAGQNLLAVKDADGQDFIRSMMDGKNGDISYRWQDPDGRVREKLASFKTFDRWGWLVATSAYADELVKEPHEVRLRMLIGTALVILLLVVITFIAMRRWVTQPLSWLVDTTRRVAAGDLTVQVAVDRGDEIGEVLSASNDMCRELRQLVSEVNQSVEGLARNADNLAKVSEDVSGSSQEQSAAVAAMAACVEEMTHSISLVNSHAGSARELAVQSDQVSRTGEVIVSRTVATMREIASASSATASTVTQLGERSEQISRVVTVIRDIADQTNLLALNAAIEAARAGEMGRGFAVVADEVRKLAERTTQSTLEISDTVARIQTEARDAVDSMNTAASQVEAGVKAASEAGDSLQSIRDGARQVEQAVVGIAEALSEQNTASQDIAHNVERVAQQADQNHHKARDASLVACDITSMAHQLQQSVARFRV